MALVEYIRTKRKIVPLSQQKLRVGESIAVFERKLKKLRTEQANIDVKLDIAKKVVSSYVPTTTMPPRCLLSITCNNDEQEHDMANKILGHLCSDEFKKLKQTCTPLALAIEKLTRSYHSTHVRANENSAYPFTYTHNCKLVLCIECNI